MADETILEQDVLTAATIANPAEWFFGVERLGFTTPHQISLSEIGVALVDPVDADITALDARLDAAEAQLLTLVTVTADITALDGRITINEGDIVTIDGRVTSTEGDMVLIDARVTALEALPLQVNVVDTVAALAAEVPVDGDLWQTKGYTSSDDGGGNLYRYDAASVEAVDGGWVLNGPGGVGRYLATDRLTIKAEHFGADPTGVADSTLALQAWADALASVNQGNAIARGLYRITDTLIFPSLRGVELTIGNADIGGNNFSTTSKDFSGLWYDGPGGSGPEPNNCKPAVWIQFWNWATINQLTVAQTKDTAQTNTTGILISSGTSNQTGNSIVGGFCTANFYRGMVIGLRNLPGGLIGHAATGYSDDVFESVNVTRMTAIGCAAGFYFGCPTSDASLIGSLLCDIYLPNNISGDLGLATTAIQIEDCGQIVIDNIGVFHTRLGQVKKAIESVDNGTDTITITAHGFSNGDSVYVYPELGATVPAGLVTNETFYYVVNQAANSFQLSTTVGGAAVPIAPGSGISWVVKVNGLETALRLNNTVTSINRMSVETHHAMILHDVSTTVGRNTHHIANLGSNYGAKRHDKACMVLNLPYTFTNPVFSGNVIYRNSIEAISPTFLLDRDTGEPFKFLEMPTFSPPVPNVIGVHAKDWDTNVYSTEHFSVLSRSVYYHHPGYWRQVQPSYAFAFDAAGSITAVDDVANTFSTTGTFANGQRVVMQTTGTLPGGITSRRYFVTNWTPGTPNTFQLSETLGGAAVDIISAGANNILRRAFDIWKYTIAATGKNYSQIIRTWAGLGGRNSATLGYAGSFETEILIGKDSASAPVTLENELHAYNKVLDGYTTFDVTKYITVDTVGSNYEIYLTIVQDNNQNQGMGIMSVVELISFAGNDPVIHPIDDLGYPGRNSGRFDWVISAV